MSLINDALKRAQGQNPPRPSGAPPWPRPRRNQRGQAPNKVLIVVLLLAAAGAVYALFFHKPAPPPPPPKASKAKPSAVAKAQKSEPELPPVVSPTSPIPEVEEKPKVGFFEALTKPPPPLTEKEATAVPAAPQEKTAAARAESEEPTTPRLRLEGVFIQPAKPPQALINGVPLKVGERIERATVTEITKDFVKLRYEGRDILLVMQ